MLQGEELKDEIFNGVIDGNDEAVTTHTRQALRMVWRPKRCSTTP